MPSRGGRVAVYIEGHAESLERASAAGVASLDKLQAKTAEVDATQRSASTGGFASYTTATSKASKATEKHTKATGRLGKATDLLGSTLKTAAASSVAFIGTYAGYTALKDAVDYTSELTHQTQILTQATGLDVTAASQWIELAKQREISTTAVSVAFKTLSKQIRNAESGSTSAKKAFHAIGIPLDELKNMKPEEVVAKISDAFAGMGDGAKKTALNAQFFGKSATALLPVLNQGSKGLEDQLNKFSGLSESQFKAGEQALEMERKISRAYDEIRLKVGVAMIGAGKSIAGWINDIGHGTGAVGKFIHDVGNILGPILEKDLKTASEAFKGFAQIWKGIAETLDGILHLRFSQMWQGIEDIFGGGAKEVVAIVKGIGRLIGGPVSAIGDALSGAFSSAWRTVEGVFTSGANTVIDVVNALIEAINVLPGVDIGSVGHIGGGKQYGQGKGEWHAGGKGLGGTSTPAHQGRVKKARGGPIDLGAPTGDTVPAMLERGEYVLNRKAVQAVGKDQLDYINFKHAPRYSVGSFIESAASTAFEYSPAGLAVKAGKAAFDFSKGVAGVVGGFPSGKIGGVFAGLGPWLVNKAVDYVKGWFGSHKPTHPSGSLAGHPELQPGIAGIAGAVLSAFPGLVVTSTTGGGHAANSYHYLGRAVDLAGSTGTMLSAAAWAKQRYGSILAEGIHNPNLSVDAGHEVPPSFWGPETWAAHANHIHLAYAKGGGVGSAQGLHISPAGQKVHSLLQSIWPYAAPLLGRNAKSKPPRANFDTTAYGGLFVGDVKVFGPKGGVRKNYLAYPTWFENWVGGRPNVVKENLIHELAHWAQRPGLANWEAEGGAEAFARWASPQIYGSAGIPYQNPPFPKSEAYYPFVQNVMKNKGWGWIKGGQFARGYSKGGGVGNFSNINHRWAPHWAPDFGGPTLPFYEVAALAEWAGMPGITMAQMAKGESGLRPGSAGVDPGGTKGYGLWAITSPFNDALVAKYGGYEEMWNPVKNALAAAEIYHSQGLGAWYGNQYVTSPDAHYTGKFDIKSVMGGTGAKGGTSRVSSKPPKITSSAGAIVAPKGTSKPSKNEYGLGSAKPAGPYGSWHGTVAGAIGAPAIGSVSKKQAIEEGRGLEWASHHLGSSPIEIGSVEQSLTERLEEANKHLEELLALQREQTESANRVLAVVQANSSSIIGSLIATISGGIGGKVGLGFQTPSFAGGGASY